MAEEIVEEEAKSTGTDVPETKEESVPKKKKRTGTKRSSKNTTRRKKKAPVYNVDVAPETGVMRLPELHYLRLVTSEQKITIVDRELQLAKARVNEFQTQANNQLLALQAKVKEMTNALYSQKTMYMNEVNAVEDATGLALKEWTIDDDRILRPIESEKSPEKKE